MLVQIQSLSLPKAGNRPEEYEDACWPHGSTVRASGTVRCAVADGATEASFSALWARLLVEAYGRGRLRVRQMSASLPALQCAWSAQVSAEPLPWYAEEKRRSGAFSSLLGLTITSPRRSERLRWSAVAVGDSCLLHVAAGELVQAFPIGLAADFGNSPYLVSSLPAHNRLLESHVERLRGACSPGDAFYLLTDALAQWFLMRHEANERPWVDLDRLLDDTDDRFPSWARNERDAHRLRNDDITVLRLRIQLA